MHITADLQIKHVPCKFKFKFKVKFKFKYYLFILGAVVASVKRILKNALNLNSTSSRMKSEKVLVHIKSAVHIKPVPYKHCSMVYQNITK